jgi:2-keto-3-deoxy-galactonokinase
MNDGSQITPTWIAVDWGTSNLRVWAMDGAGQSSPKPRPTTAWASWPAPTLNPPFCA